MKRHTQKMVGLLIDTMCELFFYAQVGVCSMCLCDTFSLHLHIILYICAYNEIPSVVYILFGLWFSKSLHADRLFE